MFARATAASILQNFTRTILFSSLSGLKTGLDILFQKENVKVDIIYGHGGLFKTERVGQSYLAAAMNAPVSVMKTAGEGGPWGEWLFLHLILSTKKKASRLNHSFRRRFSQEKRE